MEACKPGKEDGLTYGGGVGGVGAGGRRCRNRRSRSRKEEMEGEEDFKDGPPERLYTNDSTLHNATLHRTGQSRTGRVDPYASIFSYLL